MSSRGSWVFRADAGPRVGVGHVMRALSLAAAAAVRGHPCELHSRDLPADVRDVVASRGIAVREIDAQPGSAVDARALSALGARVVCIDGYSFGPSFFNVLHGGEHIVVAIDDNGEIGAAPVDVVVNQSPTASSALYEGCRDATLLMGLDFALIRPEVVQARVSKNTRSLAQRVVVSVGGSDAAGILPELVDALATTPLVIEVAVGMANPNADTARAAITAAGQRVREIVPARLPARIATADIAIVGAGVTLWEVAALGTPAIGLVVADNQASTLRADQVQAFASIHDARKDFDPFTIVAAATRLAADPARRASMSEAGPKLVDGRGTERTVQRIEAELDRRRSSV